MTVGVAVNVRVALALQWVSALELMMVLATLLQLALDSKTQ